jgi:hypothetical protein
MLISEARVETGRASEYLVKLCQHVDEAARAHSQMQSHVEWSEDRGVWSASAQAGARCAPSRVP